MQEISLGDRGELKPVSTENIIKIWLTKPGCSEPLGGFVNEMRLIKERLHSPQRTITLLYEPTHLTQDALDKLFHFCHIHDIQLLTVDEVQRLLQTSSVISEESKQTQLALLTLARKEMNDPNGNLAAASDILRTMTPVLQTPEGTPRMYLDVDDQLRPDLKQSLPLRENSVLKPYQSNHFLLTANPENPTLVAIREKILKNYSSQGDLTKAIDKARGDAWNTGIGLDSIKAFKSLDKILKDAGYNTGESGEHWQACNDIFEFRRIINQEIRRLHNLLQQSQEDTDQHQQSLDEKALKAHLIYFQNLYLYTIINVSGPDAFELPKLTKKSKETCLAPNVQSDISWGHDPKNVSEHQEILKAAKTIQRFFINRKKPEEPSAEEEACPEPPIRQ
jgi:hypothetical protein